MSIPKSHHTIPRVYLENFTETDGRLTVTSKRRGTKLRPKPAKALTRHHYYSQPVDGVDNADQTIESILFNRLESKYPRLLLSLLDADSNIDRELLAEFIFSMCIRSPAFREAFELGLADFVDQHRKSLPENALPAPPRGYENIWDHVVVTIDPHRSIHAMKHYLEHYAGILGHLDYQVCFAPRGTKILTSDSPVAWYESGYGSKCPNIHSFRITNRTRAIFPLTPKAVLIGKKSATGNFRIRRASRLLNKAQIREINEIQLACAWDEVIGEARLPKLSFERFSRLAPKFTISDYNPHNNLFRLSSVHLAKLSEKHKFTRN